MNLLLDRHGLESGPRRFTADIYNVRSAGRVPPAVATAASTSTATPSPEKLSGVTLTMPMTYVRRPQRNGQEGSGSAFGLEVR